MSEVNRYDEQAWEHHARQMSSAIRAELRTTNVGRVTRELQEEQIVLIQSIPIVAAERVHKLTYEGLASSQRASEIVKEILASGDVSKSHAELIAVTEVARATTSFTRARAEQIGSTHYIWETVRDKRVRQRHRELQGEVIAWDSPPVAGSKGERAHAGAIYRCRCWPRPLLRH